MRLRCLSEIGILNDISGRAADGMGMDLVEG